MVPPELAAAHARCQPHAQRLRLGAAPAEAIPATRFLDAGFLREEVRRYAERLGSPDLRAAASVWSKHYVASFAPAVCALMTLGGVGLDARAAACRVLRRDGVPHETYFDEPALLAHATRAKAGAAGLRTTASPDELHAFVLPALLDHHLAPLFGALHEACRLSPRIAWSNVGNSLAWYYDQFALLDPDASREDRRAILEDPASPLHDPVGYEHLHEHGLPRRVQVRRVCCLRYRLPDTTVCYTCPRLASGERASLLRDLEARQ